MYFTIAPMMLYYGFGIILCLPLAHAACLAPGPMRPKQLMGAADNCIPNGEMKPKSKMKQSISLLKIVPVEGSNERLRRRHHPFHNHFYTITIIRNVLYK